MPSDLTPRVKFTGTVRFKNTEGRRDTETLAKHADQQT